jgi:hypothetical protein
VCQVTFQLIILIIHTDTKVKYFERKVKDSVILGYINIQTPYLELTFPSKKKDEGGGGGAGNLIERIYKFNCGIHSNTSSILHQKKFYHTFWYPGTWNDSQL